MDIKPIIAEALQVLKDGGVILYPTDTVWGIGCDSRNAEAVEKVFKIKRRSDAKSLILLASDLDCTLLDNDNRVPEECLRAIRSGYGCKTRQGDPFDCYRSGGGQ